jgi:hypothetical protein
MAHQIVELAICEPYTPKYVYIEKSRHKRTSQIKKGFTGFVDALYLSLADAGYYPL